MLLGGDEIRTHPARQQQRLLPGQRSQLVSLVAQPRRGPACFECTRRLIRIRAEQPVLRRRRFLHGSRLRAIDARDIAWLRPAAAR